MLRRNIFCARRVFPLQFGCSGLKFVGLMLRYVNATQRKHGGVHVPNGDKKTANNGNNGKNQQPFNFTNKLIASIPHGRKGKHNLIVTKILADLDRLDMETAILVPLDGLDGEKMENVRSALNRATKQQNISVATSTDDKYFYVWRTEPKKNQMETVPNKLASQLRQ
jgi:hypothetical protein